MVNYLPGFFHKHATEIESTSLALRASGFQEDGEVVWQTLLCVRYFVLLKTENTLHFLLAKPHCVDIRRLVLRQLRHQFQGSVVKPLFAGISWLVLQLSRPGVNKLGRSPS